jgi:hypothetical protein
MGELVSMEQSNQLVNGQTNHRAEPYGHSTVKSALAKKGGQANLFFGRRNTAQQKATMVRVAIPHVQHTTWLTRRNGAGSGCAGSGSFRLPASAAANCERCDHADIGINR